MQPTAPRLSQPQIKHKHEGLWQKARAPWTAQRLLRQTHGTLIFVLQNVGQWSAAVLYRSLSTRGGRGLPRTIFQINSGPKKRQGVVMEGRSLGLLAVWRSGRCAVQQKRPQGHLEADFC
jgi:hypothetical protein